MKVDTVKDTEMPTDAAKDAQASPAGAEAAATDDLETARKAVEDTAAIGGGLWLSYLFVLFYLAIAAGAVTHADLLLQAPVKLPFLNIELPLLAFFFLAPLLLLLTHAYTLVHLVLLARRVAQFNAIEGLSEAWRRRLPSNIFVQFLGAPEEDRYGPFGLLLGAILWVTLVVAPIALYPAARNPVPALPQPVDHLDDPHRADPRSRPALVALAHYSRQPRPPPARPRLEDGCKDDRRRPADPAGRIVRLGRRDIPRRMAGGPPPTKPAWRARRTTRSSGRG